MSEIDWADLLKHVTPRNVAKWIAVVAFAIVAIAGSIGFCVLLWNSL